jgi:hypothetical protein
VVQLSSDEQYIDSTAELLSVYYYSEMESVLFELTLSKNVAMPIAEKLLILRCIRLISIVSNMSILYHQFVTLGPASITVPYTI